jgi:hypothetical protein
MLLVSSTMTIKKFPIRHYIIATLFILLSYSTLNLQDRIKRQANHVINSTINFEKEYGESRHITKLKSSIKNIMSIQKHDLKQLQRLFLSIIIICSAYIVLLFTIKEISLILRFVFVGMIIYFLIFHQSGIRY